MFSLRGDIAHNTFWYIYKELKAGRTFPIRESTNLIFENLPAMLLEVDERHFPDFLGWNRWFYGPRNKFKCLQLVWTDGKFPWDPSMSQEFLGDQPDLTNGEWSGLHRH